MLQLYLVYHTFTQLFYYLWLLEKESIFLRAHITIVNVVIRSGDDITTLGRALSRFNSCVVNEVNIPCRGGGVDIVSVTISTPRGIVGSLNNGVNELSNICTGATCNGI